MTATVKAPPKPQMPGSKFWKKSKPVRDALALVFILHGWLALGTDFFAWREPFFLESLRGWWAWLQEAVRRIGEFTGMWELRRR